MKMLWRNLFFKFSIPLLIITIIPIGITIKVHSPSDDLPEGVVLKDGQQFEYIVVGAGAAGSAAAARLALAGLSVLLVEAGGDPDPRSWIPALSTSLLGSDTDWQYKTIPNGKSCLSSPGGQCTANSGKCLGGSTSINDMIYVRGNPYDWDSLNISGWSWQDIKPYFLRYEGLKDLYLLPHSSRPYHNTEGPMKIQFFEESSNPWHSRVIEGFLTLNFPYNPDVNAASQIGVTQVLGYVYGGQRMSTARGYLSRNDVKKSLKVAKFTRCIRVIIDDCNITRGITVISGPLNRTLNLYATREVILSAGTMATPHILMMSGIGHADHLKDMNIPISVDLPVGDKLTDHALMLTYIKVDSDSRVVKTSTSAKDTANSLTESLECPAGPRPSVGLTDIQSFVNTFCYNYEQHQLINKGPECEVPTMQIVSSFKPQGSFPPGFSEEVTAQLADVNANHDILLISPLVLQPQSHGHVRLASSNPLDAPAVFPNLLSNEQDLDDIIRGIGVIEDLIETRPLKKHNASLVRLKFKDCPDDDDAVAYWKCYARHMTHLSYHAVGTSGIGQVVDEKLRVLGVRGLRIADLGVLPRLVRGNTAAAALAIGERVVDFLLED